MERTEVKQEMTQSRRKAVSVRWREKVRFNILRG